MKKTAAAGHTTKHTGTKKHTATKKHHPAATKKAATAKGTTVHTKAKAPAHAKARALSPGYDVACCSALALAESARLAGHAVGADDVFALYWRTARDPDAGAPIRDTLRAAWECGLAGIRPIWFGPVDCDLATGPSRAGRYAARHQATAHLSVPIILGAELPGPHALLAETGRWWSWSQPWPPAVFHAAVVEEAWAVVWP